MGSRRGNAVHFGNEAAPLACGKSWRSRRRTLRPDDVTCDACRDTDAYRTAAAFQVMRNELHFLPPMGVRTACGKPTQGLQTSKTAGRTSCAACRDTADWEAAEAAEEAEAERRMNRG